MLVFVGFLLDFLKSQLLVFRSLGASLRTSPGSRPTSTSSAGRSPRRRSSARAPHPPLAPPSPLELGADSANSPTAQPLSPLYPETFVKALAPKKRGSKLSKREEGHSDQDSWIGKIQQASARSIVISEILDSRTKDLVSVAQISDYVLSNELVSMALAMVSEDQQINRVLDELFDEEVSRKCIGDGPFVVLLGSSCRNVS